MRVLLSEGSSLSARQAISALGPTGVTIEVCDPDPLCLGRFSRFVRAWHRCPHWNADPGGYLRFLADRLDAERYDVLLAVHDQAFLLARFRDDLGRRVALALPDFAALERLQSKAEFLRVLDELGLPHPPTLLVRTRRELETGRTPPCYIKLARSTAGCGVWHVRDRREMGALADRLDAAGLLDGARDVLVSADARFSITLSHPGRSTSTGGWLQAHCLKARSPRRLVVLRRVWESVHDPPVIEHLAALGAHLNWHGGLCMDYIHDPETGSPSYIDANPRPGETLNATLSGLNLSQLLVQVSLGQEVSPPETPRPGVRTHTVVMSLMALAHEGAPRRRLLAELLRAWTHHVPYDASQDEITRPCEDPPSVIPAVYLTLRLVLNHPPPAARIVPARWPTTPFPRPPQRPSVSSPLTSWGRRDCDVGFTGRMVRNN